MNITKRRYKLLSDFQIVYEFLENNYNRQSFNGYLLPQFFEYAHTQFDFNHKLSHRCGIWEHNGSMVGIVCYELDLGECFISTAKDYEFLWLEMLEYAENELSISNGEKISLDIWTTNLYGLDDLLLKKEYTLTHTEAITIYPYNKGFIPYNLPEGFSIMSLNDESDYKKINDCLWKSFRGPVPDNNIDRRVFMQSGPHFINDLTTIIKAPNGDYACYAGMWVDTRNKYAYLEPLATLPEYRRLGLATAALMTAMKKTIPYGAEYCFGGFHNFYGSIGFDNVGYRNKWSKTW